MKTPTWKEFIEAIISHEDFDGHLDMDKAAIDFAQMHLKAALEKIANGYMDDLTKWEGNPYTGEGSDSLNLDKIMAVYPLSNIR